MEAATTTSNNNKNKNAFSSNESDQAELAPKQTNKKRREV